MTHLLEILPECVQLSVSTTASCNNWPHLSSGKNKERQIAVNRIKNFVAISYTSVMISTASCSILMFRKTNWFVKLWKKTVIIVLYILSPSISNIKSVDKFCVAMRYTISQVPLCLFFTFYSL